MVNLYTFCHPCEQYLHYISLVGETEITAVALYSNKYVETLYFFILLISGPCLTSTIELLAEIVNN